ncbi:hypothetical protein BGX26_010950 [Mortierella sp. AD094]|nr:hypothetical protein BGX26_010950 [Mortierella sp. AD094]
MEGILAKFDQHPEMTLDGKSNCELLPTIASAVGVHTNNHDLSDRIARQYDWSKISEICASCGRDGAASDRYLSTLGASLGTMQLTLLEKVRLASYLDSSGFNVFPALHRCHLSGCGCVGRRIKRLFMVMSHACNLWTSANYSSAFALRDAMAGTIKNLYDRAIATLLETFNEEMQRGRQLGG